MWVFPLMFFTYQFIPRLWPGLMINEIMSQFNMNATQFGFLASLYYYGYSGMQIPIAILLERFKTKYVLSLFAILCGVSNFIFSCTDNIYFAYLSRFLIGASSSIGFLSVSKVISQWFPKEDYTKMVSFSFTVGLIGAIYGGKPINLLIQSFNAKNVSLIVSLAPIVIGILVFFFLKDPTLRDKIPGIKNNSSENESKINLKGLKNIFSRDIMLLAIANLLLVGSLEGSADIWGISYITKVYKIQKNDAAVLISYIFIGMIFGGPILASISSKIGNKTVIFLSGILMSLIFFIILFIENWYNWYLLAIMFFVVGILCCYQVIVFSLGADLVNAKNLGITIAFLNCVNMLGGAFFHTLIGATMDIFWRGDIDSNGIRIYDDISYKYSLMTIPICAIIGSVIIYFIKTNKSKN